MLEKRSLSPSQSATAFMPHTYPDIDGYQLSSCIKQSDRTCVYAGMDKMLQMPVAIKVVSLPAVEQDLSLRLTTQAKRWLRLRHKHIVPLYRFGWLDEQTLYYVMPLLTGGDLRSWRRPAEENKVRALLCDLLDALVYAHGLGILHGAIEAKRVHFDQSGRAQLVGFGAGMDSAAQLDDASDLYALAELALELLTGTRRFDALPAELNYWQGFFNCALHPEPARRFANAAQMQAALSNTKKPMLVDKGERIIAGNDGWS